MAAGGKRNTKRSSRTGPDWRPLRLDTRARPSFFSLSPDAKLYWIFARTCMHSSGIDMCLPANVAGWTSQSIEVAMRAEEELVDAGEAVRDGPVLWIVHGLAEHSRDSSLRKDNRNHQASVQDHVAKVPSERLAAMFRTKYPEWFGASDRAVGADQQLDMIPKFALAGKKGKEKKSGVRDRESDKVPEKTPENTWDAHPMDIPWQQRDREQKSDAGQQKTGSVSAQPPVKASDGHPMRIGCALQSTEYHQLQVAGVVLSPEVTDARRPRGESAAGALSHAPPGPVGSTTAPLEFGAVDPGKLFDELCAAVATHDFWLTYKQLPADISRALDAIPGRAARLIHLEAHEVPVLRERFANAYLRAREPPAETAADAREIA